jgi:hypothetical protein
MTLSRRLAAETLGTALLLAAIVGSGIMGEKLADGNVAVALLANTLATGAMLITLILTFGPIPSGWRAAFQRIRRNLWSALRDLGLCASAFGSGSLCCRSLHHQRLLVYSFHLLCQPCGNARTSIHKHICWHLPDRRARFHCRSDPWRFYCDNSFSLACADDPL